MKSILKSLGVQLLYILLQVFVMVAYVLSASDASATMEEIDQLMGNYFLGITILSNLLTIIIIILILKMRKKTSLKLKPESFKDFVYPSLFAFMASMVFALLTLHLNFETMVQMQVSADYYSTLFPFLGVMLHVVSTLILAPIVEEILCRGIILEMLRKHYRDGIAILISGVIFGIFHVMAGGLTLIFGAVVMGMIFGLIYVKTGSLLAAIVAHSFANVPDYLIAAFPMMSDGVRFSFIFLCCVLMAIIFKKFLKDEGVYE